MIRVWDSGTDWLTLTVPPDEKHYAPMLARCARLVEELQKDGCTVKRSCWQGYTGYQARGLFVGEREDGFAIRASSRESGLIESEFRQRHWDARCTRLDLQVTAKTPEGRSGAYIEKLQAALIAQSKKERQSKVYSLATYRVAGVDTGVTIGSRSSNRYQRIYNKTVEQRHKVEPDLVRYEVEFKGEQARLMWKMLQSAASGRWLALSVVKTTFELFDLDMSFISSSEPQKLPSSYEPNDDERRLNWLQSHVRMTVKQLLRTRGREEVLRALDLND